MLIKYAIAQNYRGYSQDKYEFASQLAHEFKGMKEAVGYTDLKNAIHYNSEAEAKAALQTQPVWVKEGHRIVEFIDYGGSYSLYIPPRYKEFLEQKGNVDG